MSIQQKSSAKKKPSAQELRAKGCLPLPELLSTLATRGVYFAHGPRTVRHLQHKGLIDAPIRAGVDERRRNVAFYGPRVIRQLVRLQKSSVNDNQFERFLGMVSISEHDVHQFGAAILHQREPSSAEQMLQELQEGGFIPKQLSAEEREKKLEELRAFLDTWRARPVSEKEIREYIRADVPWAPFVALRTLWPDKTREELAAMILVWFAVIHEDLTQGNYTEAIRTAGFAKWLVTPLIPWLSYHGPASEPEQAALPVSEAQQKG